MYREMLRSKIHGAIVTETNLEYHGSIAIDKDLLDATGLIINEKVLVVNMNNGERFETYVIEGAKGSGTIGLNGAAARLAIPGDRVLVLSFMMVPEEKCATWEPKIIFVDKNNRIMPED